MLGLSTNTTISTFTETMNVISPCLFSSQQSSTLVMTIGLLGRDGGTLGTEINVPLTVPSSRTARIQEMHLLILHIWCEMLDAA